MSLYKISIIYLAEGIGASVLRCVRIFINFLECYMPPKRS